MSRENVKLVMALQRSPDEDFADLIRNDEKWARLAEAVAPFVHPDATVVRPGIPGGKTYIGLEGFRESWLDWLAPWTRYRTEVIEAIDCGDRVLLLQNSSGRLEGSTSEVTLTPAVVYTVRDGRIARFEPYADPADAFEAVGLGRSTWRGRSGR
jgi:ketosteroid isomerase-like protein